MQVAEGEYLLKAMRDAGAMVRNDMEGERALNWSEVYAYAKATKQIEKPWELEIVHNLSRAFVEGKALGSDPLSISPIEQSEEEHIGL